MSVWVYCLYCTRKGCLRSDGIHASWRKRKCHFQMELRQKVKTFWNFLDFPQHFWSILNKLEIEIEFLWRFVYFTFSEFSQKLSNQNLSQLVQFDKQHINKLLWLGNRAQCIIGGKMNCIKQCVAYAIMHESMCFLWNTLSIMNSKN